MAIRSALQAQKTIEISQPKIDKWLTLIDARIEDCIEYDQTTLVINKHSFLSGIFANQTICDAIIAELKKLGYYVEYYSGSYVNPRYLLIDWSAAINNEQATNKKQIEQEILERENINRQLMELQKSLKFGDVTSIKNE